MLFTCRKHGSLNGFEKSTQLSFATWTSGGVGDGLLLKHAPLAGVAFPRSRRQPVFQIARSKLEFVSLMIRARQLLTGKESLVADDGDVKTNSLS